MKLIENKVLGEIGRGMMEPLDRKYLGVNSLDMHLVMDLATVKDEFLNCKYLA